MKLEQAARQALEALEWWDKDGAYRPFVFKRREAITALREALAEQERKAKYDERFERLEKFEQAEQEPVAKAIHYPECWDTAAYPTLESALNQLAACFKCDNDECAAPVRTKDLTDDEIRDAFYSCGFGAIVVDGCRAVIAADREKNRGTA